MTNNNIHKEERRAWLGSDALFHKKLWLIFLIIGAVLVGLWWSSPDARLLIKERESGDILWQNAIRAGESFSHQYIHSVEKSPVKEVFEYTESGHIVTMESWTKSFGAGLPYQRKGEVEMEDGYYKLMNLNRPIHSNILRIQPSDLYRHTFSYKRETLTLSKAPFVKKVIEITVDPIPWYRQLF
ncbi:hypothetical protein J416_03671 [Gracilibacillus halophilus YIM-C55.5]|uniref:DUF1850 domain-containing protein n=1 Tax=Gracilibacillus halophilus YIM-C55.5 TaxID=1308866 RepID=N4WNV4_9BACI|nr:DUF1850 domain-containing protein [Gracilibacillus halophilus]ENH97827.1 hypothetical protein J416_03671 [Gracilibacillus halophilus YIM-C55.5]